MSSTKFSELMKLTYEPEKKISDESCISKHAASMKAEGP
jgi:hypothetical protein